MIQHLSCYNDNSLKSNVGLPEKQLHQVSAACSAVQVLPRLWSVTPVVTNNLMKLYTMLILACLVAME